jgi:glycosyltransferase involved in cell wall biosynthesis
MTKSLCIVVPIYKTKYLGITVDSLNKQSLKNFKVYFFNDKSPDNPLIIINSNDICFDYEYISFDKNLGGKNLVGQWERCLGYIKEDWIWFLGDDDYISHDAVEHLHNHLILNPKEKLNRFNLDIVDENNRTIAIQNYNYSKQSTESFIRERLSGRQYSSLNEYVFSRELFVETKGFINFPLGWCSDDATWIEMSKINNGISNIQLGKVYWRQSQLNISNNKTTSTKFKKIIASVLFARFIKKKFVMDNTMLVSFFAHQLNELEIKGRTNVLYTFIFRKLFL